MGTDTYACELTVCVSVCVVCVLYVILSVQGVESIALITREPALAHTGSIMIDTAVVLVSMELVTNACLRIEICLMCPTRAMVDFNPHLQQCGVRL